MQWLARISAFDQRLFLGMSAYRARNSIVQPALVISRSGDGYFQVLMPLLIALTLNVDAALSFILITVAAFAAERLVYLILKNSLKRRRPPAFFPAFNSIIVASDEFSFPSGHTCAAFLLWVLCSAVAPWLTIPMLLWAIAVGSSRVILGVHFPADILAGAAIGYTIGQIFLNFL